MKQIPIRLLKYIPFISKMRDRNYLRLNVLYNPETVKKITYRIFLDFNQNQSLLFPAYEQNHALHANYRGNCPVNPE